MSKVWGVDLSTVELTVAVMPEGKTLRCSIKGKSGVKRLADAYATVYRWTLEMAKVEAPIAVWVEQPTGRFPNPALVNMAGVVACAMYRALERHYGVECPMWFIPVKDWKKRAVGKGNASKEETIEWANQTFGFNGRTEDEADALGIGYAGYSQMQ